MTTKRLPPRKNYAVFDALNRKLSAGMSYREAQEAKRRISSMSRTGILQAIVAVPPFRVKKA